MKIEFLASPPDRGAFITSDGEGETTIKLRADSTQLAKVIPLMGFEKGAILKITVEQGDG